MRRAVWLATIAGVLVSGWCAAEPTVAEVLRDLATGAEYPATVKLRSLDSTWLRISGTIPGDMSSAMAMFKPRGESGGAGGVYTKGETIKLADETFLVAYRPEPPSFGDLMAGVMSSVLGPMMGGGPGQPPPPPAKPNAAPAPAGGAQPGAGRPGAPQPGAAPAAPAAAAGAAGIPGMPDFAALAAGQGLKPSSELHRVLLNLRVLPDLSDVRRFNLYTELTGAAPRPRPAPEAEPESPDEQSLDNLEAVGLALLLYLDDHRETLPRATSDADCRQALQRYCPQDHSVFEHPGTHQPYRFNLNVAGQELARIKKPAETVWCCEAAAGLDGLRGVVYLNGRAKRLSVEAWALLKAAKAVE
jgi:hypothetical protein